MKIYWDDKGKLLTSQIEILNKAVTAVSEYCNINMNSEVSISIMDKDEIQHLNRDYRGKDLATDVLSFPVDAGLVMGSDIALGDIAICIDVAEDQAKEYGHSIERELGFLVVHGMLHLYGYDHETPEDETIMMTAQDEILQKIELHRNDLCKNGH